MNLNEKKKLEGCSDRELLMLLHERLANFKDEVIKYYRTKESCIEYRSKTVRTIARWSGGVGGVIGALSATGILLGILYKLGVLK